jgi:hypothetical protein
MLVVAVAVVAVIVAAWLIGDAIGRARQEQVAGSVSVSAAQSRTGMGELRRLEAEQAHASVAGVMPSHSGMGELRRIEAMQSRPAATGMGELRRFESTQR